MHKSRKGDFHPPLKIGIGRRRRKFNLGRHCKHIWEKGGRREIRDKNLPLPLYIVWEIGGWEGSFDSRVAEYQLISPSLSATYDLFWGYKERERLLKSGRTNIQQINGTVFLLECLQFCDSLKPAAIFFFRLTAEGGGRKSLA